MNGEQAVDRPIVVDALSARVGGGLTFIEQQLRGLEAVRPDLPLVVLASPTNERVLKEALKAEVRTVKSPNLATRLLYEQTLVPFTRRNCRLLYCPGNFCPIVKTKFPVVLTLQNALHFVPRWELAPQTLRSRAETALAHASVRRADVVVTVSESLRQLVIDGGFPSANIEVVPSGVPEWSESEVKPFGIDERSDFILSVAHDHPHKRLDDLVEAWLRAWPEQENAPELLLVGEVSEARRRGLHDLIGSGPDRLRFLGTLEDRAQLKWLVQNARVLVSTSEMESFGLPLLEAASLGCPVIASDIPAHREVATSAAFFPVGRPELLACQLAETGPRSADRTSVDSALMTWERNAARLAEIFDRTAR